MAYKQITPQLLTLHSIKNKVTPLEKTKKIQLSKSKI